MDGRFKTRIHFSLGEPLPAFKEAVTTCSCASACPPRAGYDATFSSQGYKRASEVGAMSSRKVPRLALEGSIEPPPHGGHDEESDASKSEQLHGPSAECAIFQTRIEDIFHQIWGDVYSIFYDIANFLFSLLECIFFVNLTPASAGGEVGNFPLECAPNQIKTSREGRRKRPGVPRSTVLASWARKSECIARRRAQRGRQRIMVAWSTWRQGQKITASVFRLYYKARLARLTQVLAHWKRVTSEQRAHRRRLHISSRLLKLCSGAYQRHITHVTKRSCFNAWADIVMRTGCDVSKGRGRLCNSDEQACSSLGGRVCDQNPEATGCSGLEDSLIREKEVALREVCLLKEELHQAHEQARVLQLEANWCRGEMGLREQEAAARDDEFKVFQAEMEAVVSALTMELHQAAEHTSAMARAAQSPAREPQRAREDVAERARGDEDRDACHRTLWADIGQEKGMLGVEGVGAGKQQGRTCRRLSYAQSPQAKGDFKEELVVVAGETTVQWGEIETEEMSNVASIVSSGSPPGVGGPLRVDAAVRGAGHHASLFSPVSSLSSFSSGAEAQQHEEEEAMEAAMEAATTSLERGADEVGLLLGGTWEATPEVEEVGEMSKLQGSRCKEAGAAAAEKLEHDDTMLKEHAAAEGGGLKGSRVHVLEAQVAQRKAGEDFRRQQYHGASQQQDAELLRMRGELEAGEGPAQEAAAAAREASELSKMESEALRQSIAALREQLRDADERQVVLQVIGVRVSRIAGGVESLV